MDTTDKLKIEAYIKAILGAADGIENLRDAAAKSVSIGLIHCPYCGYSSVDVEAATKHDGDCERHPMALQCAALRAELAAANERIARYNEMSGRDADELAQLRASLADCSTALDLTIAERDRYADDAGAEREKRELAEQASRYNLDVCEQMEGRAKLAEEQRDALAAVLDLVKQWWSSVPAIIGDAYYQQRCVERENLRKQCLTAMQDPTAILASVKADQRRKGAAWALRVIMNDHDKHHFSIYLHKAIEDFLAAIERNEVEVGG